MNNHDLKGALEFAFEYASEINKYVDDMTPWKISIDTQEEKEKLENILFILISNLRKIALMLLPFFDSKMRELLQRIGVNYDNTISFRENMGIDPVRFFVAEKGEALYMRVNTIK